MKNIPKVDLSIEEFRSKLKQELDYHAGDGTRYRQQTARLSLEIALNSDNVNPFLTPEESKERVLYFFPFLDEERKNDVAKMLRVVAKSMYIDKTTPNEVREYVANKLKSPIVLTQNK